MIALSRGLGQTRVTTSPVVDVRLPFTYEVEELMETEWLHVGWSFLSSEMAAVDSGEREGRPHMTRTG